MVTWKSRLAKVSVGMCSQNKKKTTKTVENVKMIIKMYLLNLNSFNKTVNNLFFFFFSVIYEPLFFLFRHSYPWFFSPLATVFVLWLILLISDKALNDKD